MRKSKGFQKEWEDFAKNYEEEIREMLVLTSEQVGGAGSFVKGIWMPSADFLASADADSGEVNGGKGQLSWLAEDKDSNGWIFHLKPLTVYRVKCRRRKVENVEGNPSRWENEYMLVDVVERGLHNAGLSAVLEEYKKPVFIEDGLCGKFELERAYNWFHAKVSWLGEECSVTLECDEEDDRKADGALAAFREIYAGLEEWDRKFRTFAAGELTELANEWQDEDDYDDCNDGEEDGETAGSITEEIFSKRISISEFSIDAEGNYTAYYEDDDMFYGHVIVVEGNVKDGIRSADIAG